jgi:hypothetical protein
MNSHPSGWFFISLKIISSFFFMNALDMIESYRETHGGQMTYEI